MTYKLPEQVIPGLPEMEAIFRSYLPENFPINNTDEFSPFRTLTLLAAKAGLDAMAFSAALVPQGFPLLATGAYLDEHAASVGKTRIPADFAVHEVTVTVNAATSLSAGDIVQTDPDATGKRLRFIVQVDTAIPTPSGKVLVKAEQPGTAHNVGPGRITTLVTVNPAVTSVTNLPGSLTSAGVDEESDDLLRERYQLAWTGSSVAGNWRAYVSWAREVPGIIKVKVLDDHPRGQGTVDLIVAPAAGAPTLEQIASVNLIVQDNRPVTADVLVRGPDLQPLDFAVTLYPKPSSSTTVPQWQARIQAIMDLQGIGQTFYPSSVIDGLMNTGELFGVETPVTPVTPDPDSMIVSGTITVTT